MAVITLSNIAERWLDEVLLYGTAVLGAGEIADDYLLPATVGDVAILEAQYSMTSIATMIANPELWAVQLDVINSARSSVDIVGHSPIRRYLTTALSTYFSPDPLVYWRVGERLLVQHTDVDTNAAPTVQSQLLIKVVRVRPQEGARQPLRLTR